MNREFKNRFGQHFCSDEAPSFKFIKTLALTPHLHWVSSFQFGFIREEGLDYGMFSLNSQADLVMSISLLSSSVLDFLLCYKIEFRDQARAVNFPSN